MAEQLTIEAKPRTALRKQNSSLRRAGIVPLSLYGKGVESTPLEADEKTLRRTLQHATASSLIKVTVEGKSHNVVVRSIQRHPITGNVLHADLFQVRMDQAMRVALPLVVVGEAPAVKTHDGIVQHLIDVIHVEGLPGDLPHDVQVDISGLTDLDQGIHVKDLSVPAKVNILDDPEELVVKIQPPRISAEEAAPAAEAAAPAEQAEQPAEAKEEE